MNLVMLVVKYEGDPSEQWHYSGLAIRQAAHGRLQQATQLGRAARVDGGCGTIEWRQLRITELGVPECGT
jgi:hypothetical protein